MSCNPFKQIFVDHLVKGETRIYWELRPDFFDAGPYSFQLQHSFSGIPNADDWTNVGLPAVNTTFLTDDAWRETGKVQLSNFRVRLATPTGTYISNPASVYSAMTHRDWAITREIIRKEKLRGRLALRPCVLIKRRRYGTPCPVCLNTLTNEVRDSSCPQCLGTGILLGYHTPYPCIYVELPEISITETQDVDKGTSRDDLLSARTLGMPMLHRYDVVVDSTNDDRWLVDQVSVKSAIRSFPIITVAGFRPVPMTHPVYQLAVNTACQTEQVLETPDDSTPTTEPPAPITDPGWLV